MLVHICCSVDSHYFLERVRDEFPDEKLIGFFYDPNIHPYSEYKLRLLDVQRSCKELGIELIEGEYNFNGWLEAVKGLEDEPEKGERCQICFDNRLSETVKVAQQLGEKRFTTTLLISPLKSQEMLKRSGEELQKESGVEFIFRDYRSNGGVEKQGKAVKENRLYRQNYCGCFFALKKQRDSQDRLMAEMFSPITEQILPASIEERLQFYSRVNKNDTVVKESFLNYRLLSGKVSIKKESIPSYFIFYSHSERFKISGRVENIVDEVGYLNRDNLKIISLSKLNKIANKSFETIFDIKLSITEEIEIRANIDGSSFSLSPIIVLENIPDGKVDFEIQSKIYVDNREVIKE